MPSIADTCATWATTLDPAQIPAETRDQIGLHLADAVGLVAAAWNTDPGMTARDIAADLGGTGSDLLFDRVSIHPAASALAHGTLIHTLDYDDTLPESVIHPMSVLAPAAWAASDDDTTGEEILTALAAGGEFLARLGAEAGRAFHARGFQATSVCGPLAAALVVGVLRKRSPESIAAAMGLAGSMSGGVLEFLSDGTWSKRLHPGWAAHGGVIADMHASRGFPGPASIVEGRHGLFSSFLSRGVKAEDVVGGLGEVWESRHVELKLYPCAHVLHPFIAMAADLRARIGAVERIDEVVCTVAPWYVPIVCEPRAEKLDPASAYQASTSLLLAVSLALLDGDVGATSFDLDSVRRPPVRALADRVTVVENPELDAGFGARIQVRLHDGTRIDGNGSLPTDVPGRAKIKFRSAFGGDSAPELERLWDAVREFDRHPWSRVRQAADSASRLLS